MNTTSRTVKLFLIYLFVCESATLEEGDSCKLDDGSHGVCTLILRCRSAIEALDQGVLPTACGFIGIVIVACCKDNVAPILPPASRVPSFPAPPLPQMISKSSFGSIPLNRTAGLIAEKMCKKYSKYAIERKEADTLTIIPTYSEVLECAIDSQPLIVGGSLAAIKEFPHMALVGYQKEPIDPIEWNCGGTLISHNFVLTASHCFYHEPFGFAKFVRVGITNQTDLSHMQQLEIQQRIPHPEASANKYHDIGLLKLASDVKMNPYARAACLFTEKQLPNVKVIASGWGRTKQTGNPSDSLLKVSLELFPEDVCNNIYRSVAHAPGSVLNRGIVDDWMICAGSTEDKRDACTGDSGGPLQIVREDTDEVKCMYNIIGITSFGKGCGLAKNQPGVYTRVSHYISWIEDEVWLNNK